MFTSGQIALDPESGEFIGGDVATQAERVLENLRAVLAAADIGFGHVVKTTIYLTDMNDFSAVNEVYGGYFGDVPPAREAVAVKGLPRGVNVEISGVAVKG